MYVRPARLPRFDLFIIELLLLLIAIAVIFGADAARGVIGLSLGCFIILVILVIGLLVLVLAGGAIWALLN